ncbi:MAG TPA: vWA domain-containing protein [Pyrinomonadaceae bacterium]|nr:vWA domain-containing protein [Pyrinomonadaceae bacterium]
MKSLPIKILTALITFSLGVAIASLWLSKWMSPAIEPIALHSPPPGRLEMVFVLDTTGSMGGLIEGAKQRIWGIVNEVMQESHSSVKVGLVAYRDRGDQYVTQVLPLTEDLDEVYMKLMNYEAAGGGDTREDVRSALSAGLNRTGWSPAASDLSQIIFLVGDAPPHDDYEESTDTLLTARFAVEKGIIVNTIQCGPAEETKRAWQAIAKHGNGQYFAIEQSGGVQAITTPFDEELGRLANRLGSTFVVYGFGADPEGATKREARASLASSVEVAVQARAPAPAKAERALNKAISSKAYVGDLLQSIENGSVQIESINPSDLPADLQTLSADERRREIEKRLAERREIRAQIVSLSRQRQAFIDAEKKKRNAGKDGFDEVVSKSLMEQLRRKKIK